MLAEGGLQVKEGAEVAIFDGKKGLATSNDTAQNNRLYTVDGDTCKGNDNFGNSKLVVVLPAKAEAETSLVQDARGVTIQSPNPYKDTFAEGVEKGQLGMLPEDDDCMISEYFGGHVDILSCGSPNEPVSDNATQLDSVPVFEEAFLPPPENAVPRAMNDAVLLNELGPEPIPEPVTPDGVRRPGETLDCTETAGNIRSSCKSVSEIFLDMPDDEWNLLEEKDGPLAEAVMSWNNLLEDGFTLVDNSTLRMAAQELVAEKNKAGIEEGEKSTSHLDQPSCATADSGPCAKPLDHTSPPLQLSSTGAGTSITQEARKDGKHYSVGDKIVIVKSKRTPHYLIGKEGVVKGCNSSGWYTIEVQSGANYRLQAGSMMKFGMPVEAEETDKKASGDMATSPTRELTSILKKRSRQVPEEQEANPYAKVYSKASRRRVEIESTAEEKVAREPAPKFTSRGSRSLGRVVSKAPTTENILGANGKHQSVLQTKERSPHSMPISIEKEEEIVMVLRREMNRFEECVPWVCCHSSWRKMRVGWRKGVKLCSRVAETAERLKELCFTLANGRQPRTPEACGEWQELLEDLGEPSKCTAVKLIAVWAKTQNLGIKQAMILENTAKAKVLAEIASNVVVSDRRGHADTQAVMAAVEATTTSGDDRLLMATLESLPKGNADALDAIKGALLWEQLKCQQALEQRKRSERTGEMSNSLDYLEPSENIKQETDLNILDEEWEEDIEISFPIAEGQNQIRYEHTFMEDDKYLTDLED